MGSSRRGLVGVVASAVIQSVMSPAQAATTLDWKGHTWQVTSGGMAGVCKGDPKNLSVDGNGYLHFKIASVNGVWTASEMFTTDKLGFGTYQWQVDGPIDTYDKNVVLGFFPYGPAAGIGADGTNEIDIEYSRWGQAAGPNGDWTDYPASGNMVGELSYSFSLGGATLSTSRFAWSRTAITSSLFGGLTATDGVTGLIKSWTYAPTNPTINIPQQALPLGMNLWCFNSPPSDGKPVEIVIRDFQFVPEGPSAGNGGDGGKASGGAGGTGGLAGPGGTSGGGGGASGEGGDGEAGHPVGHGGAASSATGGAPEGTGGQDAGTGGHGGTTGAGGSTGGAGASTGAAHANAGCSCSTTGADVPGYGCAALLAGLAMRVRRRERRSN